MTGQFEHDEDYDPTRLPGAAGRLVSLLLVAWGLLVATVLLTVVFFCVAAVLLVARLIF